MGISINMIRTTNARAEKAARKLAKELDTTISEAVAVACERLLSDEGKVANARRRRARLDRVLKEIWKRHPLPKDEAERARLADHSTLYGPDGLPR